MNLLLLPLYAQSVIEDAPSRATRLAISDGRGQAVLSHKAVEAALYAWRDAEHRLTEAIGTEQENELRAEAEQARDEYHRLLAEQDVESGRESG